MRADAYRQWNYQHTVDGKVMVPVGDRTYPVVPNENGTSLLSFNGDVIKDDIKVELAPKLVANVQRIIVFAAGTDVIQEVRHARTESMLRLIGRVMYWAAFVKADSK